MNEALQRAIDEQINKELYSAYLYLAMSVHFAAEHLDGFAHWMRAQAAEEREHALRLVDHMNERGVAARLDAVAAPPSEFGSPLSIFEQALEHERDVTASIHRLYKLALDSAEYPTQLALEWFITEQVEEENSAETIVQRLRMVADNRAALLMMDRELAGRRNED